MRIVSVSAEVAPFAKTGGLADVADALTRALASLGHRTTVVFPRYRTVNAARAGFQRAGKPATIRFARHAARVSFWRKALADGADAVAVECPELYDRFGGLYGPPGADFPDNAERFLALARAAVEWCRGEGEVPDLFHAHDWHAGMLPVLLQNAWTGEEIAHVPCVFTIHNMAYQGTFERTLVSAAGLPPALARPDELEHFGRVSFLAAGIRYAAAVTTVSRRYAEETRTSDEFGRGMQGLLAARGDWYLGILNGIDAALWDPANDAHLPEPIAAPGAAGKRAAATAVRREMALDEDPGAMLLGAVTRLDAQKGLDLLAAALPEIVDTGCQVAVLGVGDPTLERELQGISQRNKGRIALCLGFNDPLAHRIYAGADAYLMPSRFEPCGLGQMIALRYGTIPIVRETGGLAETVSDADAAPEGNGFVFQEAAAGAVVAAVRRARTAWSDRPRWERLVARAMNEDHSWTASARAYESLFERVVRERRELGRTQ